MSSSQLKNIITKNSSQVDSSHPPIARSEDGSIVSVVYAELPDEQPSLRLRRNEILLLLPSLSRTTNRQTYQMLRFMYRFLRRDIKLPEQTHSPKRERMIIATKKPVIKRL